MKWQWIFFLFLINCDSTNVSNPTQAIKPICSSERKVLTFENLCNYPKAKSQHAYTNHWKSWAFFKTPCNGSNYSNLAIGIVSFGFKGIYVSLDTVHIKAWANQDFSYAGEVVNLQNSSIKVGAFQSKYSFYDKHGEHVSPYRLDNRGRFEYGNTKLVQNASGLTRVDPRSNTNQVVFLPIVDDKDVVPTASYAINLLLKNNQSGSTMRFDGPVLKDFAALLQQSQAPNTQELGLGKMLNPAHEGSIFRWIAKGRKHNLCRHKIISPSYRNILNNRLGL
ncbi:MAG: hypothetical protein ACR2M7_01320 [Bdellovibrionales bacterium]